MWIGTIQQCDPKVSKEQFGSIVSKIVSLSKNPFLSSSFKKAWKLPIQFQATKNPTLQSWSIFQLCKETTNIKLSSSSVCLGTFLLILMTLKNVSCCFPIRICLHRERAWGSIVSFSSLSTTKLIINFQSIVTWKTGLLMLIYFKNWYMKHYFVSRILLFVLLAVTINI